MKVSELILELARVRQDHGDIECLVEILDDDDSLQMYPVGEVSVDDRLGHGISAGILA